MNRKQKRRLSPKQERQRIEGLRMLARIIARHYLANPELYANGVVGDRDASAVNGPPPAVPGDDRRGGRGVKRRQPSSRVKLNPHAVWELLNRLNMTQNELATRVGTSSGYLSQMMSGTRCPSAEMRKRLMEALGVTRFEDLFVLEAVS